jgi:hypothetical protein
MMMGEAAVKAAGGGAAARGAARHGGPARHAGAGSAAGVPDGYDQVVRRERFEAAHPAVRITCDGRRDWRATWSLGGPPLATRLYWQLGKLLDELDGIAAVDAGRRQVMEDFPGWHCYVTRRGPMEWWRAFPLGTGVQGPPEVIAATPAGLRDVIAAAVRAQWKLTVPEGAAA